MNFLGMSGNVLKKNHSVATIAILSNFFPSMPMQCNGATRNLSNNFHCFKYCHPGLVVFKNNPEQIFCQFFR